jgi:hypothetical protein
MWELLIKDNILFQDRSGKILHFDEVDALTAWEIEERGITRYYDSDYYDET